MKLSRLEQETIILFNEEEKTAKIEVHNGKLKRRLAELAQMRPHSMKLIRQDEFADTYAFPKSWIKINPTRILSEEQRAVYIERAKSNLHAKSVTVVED